MENKVYLIFECSGLYEDYEEYLLKAFFNKDKAKQFQKQKEKTLEILEKYFIPVTEEIMEQDDCNEYYINKYKNKGLVKIK